ncbi:sulfite exporter TauE/SafE family protein [Methylocella sp.]|uniref:sulfite exporter TauE/SafE family protein n=1 Tax=Methylocella sp. TaxID=1978226 RepID=UPI0037841A3C
MLSTILVGLGCGVLIGSVGVGGVLLVPSLTQFSGVPVQTAIAASMGAYVVAGVVGAVTFARRGAVDWREARPLWIGSAPAAALGAFAARLASPAVLEALIAAAAILSGLYAMRRPAAPKARGGRRLGGRSGLAIGAVAGFLSALTGTSGPVVLMPVLLWLGVEPLTAVGLAQTIQIPIALLASAGNFATGSIDLPLAGLIALGLGSGALAGARMAQEVRPERLRRAVALMLIGTGLLLCLKVAARLAAAPI